MNNNENNNQQYLIKNLSEISLEVINYYKNNLEIAKQQYDELIKESKLRGLDKTRLEGYFEIHHIVARCLGGQNDESNLVLLTYKEHVFAHLLLHILNPDNNDLFLAFSLLIQVNHGNPSEPISVNLDYLEELKKSRSELMKGENNPMKNPETAKKMSEHRKGIASFAGKHHTEETIAVLSAKTKALGWVGEKHPMFGKHHSPESIQKMKDHHKSGPIKDVEAWKDKLSKAKKQKVVGPDGTIYDSVRDAAKILGIHRATLSRYLNHKPEKGYRYL